MKCKRLIIYTGVIIVSLFLISTATAVPYTNNKTDFNKLNTPTIYPLGLIKDIIEALLGLLIAISGFFAAFVALILAIYILWKEIFGNNQPDFSH